MRLSEIVKDLENTEIFNFKDIDIKGITDNSKQVENSYIFGAFKGLKTDGLNFIDEAIRKGAKTILTHKKPDSKHKIPWIYSTKERLIFSILTKRLFNHIDEKIKITGITGTNGKTSVAYITESILNFGGIKSGVIGTIDYRWGNEVKKADLTTPQPPFIFKSIKKMIKGNVSHLLLEVSSHGIDMERVSSLDFNYGVFTNLSGDHMDYHRSINEYFGVKKRFFKWLDKKQGISFVNIDDKYGFNIINNFPDSTIAYGIENKRAKIKVKDYEISKKGIKANVKTQKGNLEIKTNLIGKTNLYNLLPAIGIAIEEGVNIPDIENCFRKSKIIIPGRLERVINPYTTVFVDYSHSDDSLKKAIITIKEMGFKNIITVFGAGGDRDRTKRPRMGKVATSYSDKVIITSDNPRTEKPVEIIKDIKKGVKRENYRVVVNRKQAIKEAIKVAGKDDAVLVAGKGHEDYQILGTKRVHFSDHEQVKEALKEVKGKW